MALNIDYTKALRRPSDMAGLVAAIHGASEGDESIWLEWKTDLDLTQAGGRIHVARSILGLANRDPKAAERFCEGLGYLVVGVEPSNLCGTTMIDPADLENGLAPYLGGSLGPIWSAHWVAVDGHDVLVIAVEAPRAGDPIALLRREGPGGYRKGAVFIRKQGKTDYADDSDLDMLQSRLRSAPPALPDLEVSIVGGLPLPWFDLTGTSAELEAWVEQERKDLLEQARIASLPSPDERPMRPGIDSLTMKAEAREALRALGDLPAAFRPTPDQRTMEEFETEVEAWTDLLREAAPEVMFGQVFANGRALVRVRIANQTQTNLAAVEVKLHFPGDQIEGFDEPWDEVYWPTPPRMLGTPKPAMSINVPYLDSPLSFRPTSPHGLRRTWIEDGSVNVTWDAGDLRPHGSDESDEIYLFITEAPPGGILRGTWSTTSKSVDAVMSGVVEVPVAATGVTALDLFREGAALRSGDRGPADAAP